ncbi:MAG: GNAT family N-acetyltransferase, partial [Rubellimicrobium sp.]|nr:GNAT family N-acetyltransferase [Rubellimicrobium sp.]
MTTPPGTGATLSLHRAIAEIDEADWDACACPEAAGGGRPFDPFTTWRFLATLEESGSVGPGTGWEAHHLALRAGGCIVAVAPLYAKGHSQGEYIFDFAWADAWQRAGGRYYPKLQIAVPFTPVTGRRFLIRPGHEGARAALIEGAVALARDNGLSSLHVTFCTGDEAREGAALGLLPRLSEQFHWHDRGYGDFDGFLAALSSRKRKAIRHERATAQAFGGEIVALTGADLAPRHWAAMWEFYQDTGSRKWGQPYLTRAFFDLAAERLRDDALMVLALRDGRPVAGALNLIGREALFGRYWGTTGHHP